MNLPEHMSLKTSVHSLEDAIITLSGPALAISGIIAGVDLLTGGHMLQQIAWLSLAWAITLLLTLDFQVLSLGARAHKIYLSDRATRRKVFEILLAVVIAAAISYVSVQMQSIIARSNSAGLDISTATVQLGINPIALIWERSALVLVLIFMSGWFREEQPGSTVQSEVQQVQPDMNALFERLETMYAQRIETLVERTVERVTISIEQQQLQQSPALAIAESSTRETLSSVVQTNEVQPEQAIEPAEQEEGSIGSMVQSFIEQQRAAGHEPTIAEVMNVTGCSKGTASRYKNRKGEA